MKQLRVAVETQYTVGMATGLGIYARRLVEALRRRDDVEIFEIIDPSFDVWRFDRRLYWDQLRAPWLSRAIGADISHFTGGTLPLRTPHPVVLTLHDLAWLQAYGQGRPYIGWYFGALQSRIARRADAIVTDTECSRFEIADALKVHHSRIVVAGAGVDASFFSIQRQLDASPFLLSVGTVEQRKDLVTAVKVISLLPGLRLVSVGPKTPYVNEVLKTARALDVVERVEVRGYVDEETLISLYARATALIFPSRYEGFGLPPLQALAAGLPAVTSCIPVLQEVLADCAWYAPVADVTAFAKCVEKITQGGQEVTARIDRGRDQARRFSWDSVAEKVMAIYNVLR